MAATPHRVNERRRSSPRVDFLRYGSSSITSRLLPGLRPGDGRTWTRLPTGLYPEPTGRSREHGDFPVFRVARRCAHGLQRGYLAVGLTERDVVRLEPEFFGLLSGRCSPFRPAGDVLIEDTPASGMTIVAVRDRPGCGAFRWLAKSRGSHWNRVACGQSRRYLSRLDHIVDRGWRPSAGAEL